MVGDMEDVTTVESRHPHESKAPTRANDAVVWDVIGVCRPIRNVRGICSAWFISNERDPTPMNKIVHYIGLDVHKDSMAVSIAADTRARSSEARLSFTGLFNQGRSCWLRFASLCAHALLYGFGTEIVGALVGFGGNEMRTTSLLL
jgi:hypothetical protein